MNHPLRSAHDYELFIDTLQERFPSVRRSTVILVRLVAVQWGTDPLRLATLVDWVSGADAARESRLHAPRYLRSEFHQRLRRREGGWV